jgi:DNA-binding NarL/FixJ family response regulator
MWQLASAFLNFSGTVNHSLDNLLQLQLLRALIEGHAGWHVCGEAGDGQEALTKVSELKPDLVVLDFAMASLNGLQGASKIRGTSATLPIVLHTVHVFPAMMAEAKKAGVQEVVSKSDTGARLIGVIEELLKQRLEETVALPSTSPELGSPDLEIGDGEQEPPEPN